MRAAGVAAGWMVATVVLAAGTAYVVSRSVTAAPAGDAAAVGGSEEDFHRWMHRQLEITPEQDALLEPYEEAFEEARMRLRGEIARAGRDLADAVRDGDPGSPEIGAALERLNAARGELQRVTLEHFFAMKEHLEPAQAEQLLQWTHDSLVPE